MIDCYFLGVCRGSALDRDTNNFTLFQLLEEVQVPEPLLGQTLPFEMHFYLAVTGESINAPSEFQIVWKEQDGREQPGANVFRLELSHDRVRNRTFALQLPIKAGAYRIYLEWRTPNTKPWTRSVASWPLTIGIIDESSPHSPSAPPVSQPT